MAMPRPRRIEVDGKVYKYLIKAGKTIVNDEGESEYRVRVIVELDNKKYATGVTISREKHLRVTPYDVVRLIRERLKN